MVNQKKSVPMPSQELDFLGFHLCLVTMSLSITSEKLKKIPQVAKHIQDHEFVSVWEIRSKVAGKTTSTITATSLVSLHCRAHTSRRKYKPNTKN